MSMFDIDSVIRFANGIVGDYRLRELAERRREVLQRLYPELHFAVIAEPWGWVVHVVRPKA